MPFNTLLLFCESWIITEKLKQSLNSFATNCYRVMLNIKRLDRISNAEIYKRIGIDELVLQIQRRQLRFVGHSLRRPENELINKYVLYQPIQRHGKRKPGKSKTLYPEYIGKLINSEVPPTADEMRKAARDRKEWSKLVDACKPKIFAAD